MAIRQGRTSNKGKHARPRQYKRIQYTYDFKVAVIQHYAFAASVDLTIVTFFSHIAPKRRSSVRSLISKWRKMRATIEELAGNVRTAGHTRRRDVGEATVLGPGLERDLVVWINNLRRDGIPVSNLMLQLKAIELADNSAFVASTSWKASFLARHKLSFRARNRAGQSQPDDDHVLGETFAWMKEHGVARVYNADQTGVQFEMLPKKTVSARGVQVVWVRCGSKEKHRVTAMLLADSDGNKYPVFLVFKAGKSTIAEVQIENDRLRHGFGRGIWEEAKAIQDAFGMEVYGNPTVWWNSDITVAWLEFHFGGRSPSDEPILLLLDSFSGHWTEDVLAAAARLNVKLKAVPPKLTWRYQPADVAWIKPLKDCLRRKWVEHLRAQLSRRTDSTVPFRVVSPSRYDVADWINAAWGGLATKTVVSGFSKCGFRGPYTPHEEDTVPRDDDADETELVDALCEAGAIDVRVGEVSDAMDVLDVNDSNEDDVSN